MEETCERGASNSGPAVRTTRAMFAIITRGGRVTHPTPESLIPFALGADDPATALHVAACVACQAEIAQLREAAALLHSPVLLERRIETPDCLDELVIADFVDGRLTPEARAAAVAHLLACARCRSVVSATGRLIADGSVASEIPGVARVAAESRRRRWPLPLGLAAAAALALLLWPRSADDRAPGLREPTLTTTVAPLPIAPRDAVMRVDRLVWSSVPRAERYRLRLYDAEGTVVWRVETPDTSVALPDSIALSPGVTYFWRVEAETEWRRWASSELVEFRPVGPRR